MAFNVVVDAETVEVCDTRKIVSHRYLSSFDTVKSIKFRYQNSGVIQDIRNQEMCRLNITSEKCKSYEARSTRIFKQQSRNKSNNLRNLSCVKWTEREVFITKGRNDDFDLLRVTH